MAGSREREGSMNMFLSRFDSQSKLLLRSLMSGASGVHRAVDVFHRQQRSNPEMSVCHFIETLCEDEVTCSQTGEQPLSVKPLVSLFPALLKQNLLSFVYLIHSVLPQTSVLRLLKCLSQDPHPNAWISALCRQIRRSVGVHDEEPLYTPLCSQRLKELSQRLAVCAGTGGWAMCLSDQTVESGSQSASSLSELGTRGKGKRARRTRGDIRNVGKRNSCEEPQPAPDCPCESLPEHIKVAVLQIKELLESHSEWDQSSMDVFKVLNDCDPAQVEVLCSTLSLPDVPEPTLPKLCSSVLTLSPDLSYSTAAALIKSLLLEKVLSLSEPASRCLVTAVTSLCVRYPRPMCHSLIGPILKEKEHRESTAELLNRLIEGCLDSHYRLLLLQMTFQVAWSEAVLSVIHSLLESRPDLNEEVFTQFTEQLLSQGPQFTKSVKFAKMMLTVLTKYSSHVTAAHKHSLSCCLTSNETFLKKSLQAALKRITHTT
ncbi:unnamed protein product [Pleuronectes platessa]|uniref:Fanconi Anaemia group E protein C-terminal domain-containing protein n=1 Tax=Pleuronectes platessa TaxID=8262 RepID=A0A9N7YWW5_PLEPL|nr:unnamed protein product [Pleuronectes platessa]